MTTLSHAEQIDILLAAYGAKLREQVESLISVPSDELVTSVIETTRQLKRLSNRSTAVSQLMDDIEDLITPTP